jgi:thiol-disulfide isomerase/thioredoxin
MSSNFVEVNGVEHYLKLVEGENRSQNRLILVDFGAPWCPPCQRLKPLLRKLSENYQQDLLVLAIDCDEDGKLEEDQQISPLFKIEKLPVIRFVRNGKLYVEPEHSLMGCDPKGLNECLKRLTNGQVVLK